MEFSDALVYMKTGDKISRSYWERGKVIYVASRENGLGKTIEFINERGSTGVWIPNNADILAIDWNVVEGRSGSVSNE